MDGKVLALRLWVTISWLSLALCPASLSQKGSILSSGNKRSSVHVSARVFFLSLRQVSFPSFFDELLLFAEWQSDVNRAKTGGQFNITFRLAYAEARETARVWFLQLHMTRASQSK
jgi:hypothetical protein